MDFRRLVRAMLVPHRRENAELGDGRLAADERADALVLLRGQPMGGNERRTDFRAFGRLARLWLRGGRLVAGTRRTFYVPPHHRPRSGSFLVGARPTPRSVTLVSGESENGARRVMPPA